MVFDTGSINSSSKLLPLVDSYLDYFAGSSRHTAKAKRLDLNKFINFLARQKGYAKTEKLKLKDWSHSSTQNFVDYFLDQESPATVARRLATIKHCGRTLAEKIAGFTNPAKEVKTPKIQKAVPKALTKAEIKKVLKQARKRLKEKSSFIRYRNQVVFCFLLETGLRADEVRLLKLSQLDQELSWIKNVRTKGKRYRNVYVNTDLSELLEEYLEHRQQELLKFFPKLNAQIDGQIPLFISTYGAKAEDPASFLMGAKTIWRAINELGAELGLHPHLLRHTFALDLLKSSKDIRLVSQALGHGDVRITMQYTERGDHEVALAIEQKERQI